MLVQALSSVSKSHDSGSCVCWATSLVTVNAWSGVPLDLYGGHGKTCDRCDDNAGTCMGGETMGEGGHLEAAHTWRCADFSSRLSPICQPWDRAH